MRVTFSRLTQQARQHATGTLVLCLPEGGPMLQALHAEVVARIEDWLRSAMGWEVLGATESPITGPEGNKEFLVAARKGLG